MSFYMQDFTFTELFLEMHCERNEGNTKNLILRGYELVKKVGKRVTDGDMIQIVDFLKKHPEIVAVEFPYNDISDCGLSTLTQLLRARSVIRHLNLIGNNIGSRGIEYLVALGPSFPLLSLRLSGNKFGAKGGMKLASLLYFKTGLRFLDLADTHQTMSSLAHIMTAMMGPRGGIDILEYVDIGRPLPQDHHQVCDAHAAEFIGQILKVSERLKELHCQQYHFDFRDVEIMLEGLLTNRTLLCLDLNNNNIGDDGVGYLCKYLRTSPPLECLMIGANNFGDIGATTLGFNLPYSKIKLLDVTNNRITDTGMKNIFYTIKKTVPLRALFIWGNTLTQESLVVLQRLFHTKLLDEEHTDVRLYCVDKELHAAWYPYANRFAHRFYSVSDYGHPPMTKLRKVSPTSECKPLINYKFHVEDEYLGFSIDEWNRIAGSIHIFEITCKIKDPLLCSVWS